MLSEPIQGLLQRLKNQHKHVHLPSEEDSYVNVNKITEKAGALYEKVRYLVDYKDERHIRRSAIERILKRKILFEGGQTTALSIIQELIAGGYLLNNSVSESTVEQVDMIIRKYIILEHSFPANFAQRNGTRNILVNFISSEIEAFFYPSNEDEIVADAFSATIADHVKVDTELSPQEISIQMSIACYRSFLNTDDETLRYKLWVKSNNNWFGLEDERQIQGIGNRAPEIISAIEWSLQNSLSFKLVPKLGNYAIYFSIIREIVRLYGAESERVFSDEAMLDNFIKDFLEKNYKKQFLKARDSSFRAVLYIFCTKIMLALALEVPFEIYILKSFGYVPLAINVVAHPIILLCMTLSTSKLSEDNTKRVISGVRAVISGEGIRLIKVGTGEVGLFTMIFYMLYAVMFLIIFGLIVFVLSTLGFSIVSTLLFLCFLALVSYFALRIRHSANKWKVSKEEDRLMSLLFNLFALPIIRTGKWLSRKFSSINLFAFVLDFIIETPFKFILHFSDSFVTFLKEKQEDIY